MRIVAAIDCKFHALIEAIWRFSLPPCFSGVLGTKPFSGTVSTVSRAGSKTVKTVPGPLSSRNTPLKQGVNEIGRARLGWLQPLALVLVLLSRIVDAAQPGSSTKAQGNYSDFEALTGTQSATVAKPAAANASAPVAPPAAPVPPVKSDATFVSNVLTLAAASTNTSPVVSLNGYVPDDKYKLRVGDRLSFQIAEDRDPPKALMVADNGELDVPYLGRVSVVDKTCKQLTGELKKQLEREYYYRATVIVALDLANKVLGRIYVWGQVKNQGPLEIAVNENLTVGKAILRAGGFGDFANKKRVKVIRGSGADGPGKQSFELNLVEILEKGMTEKDVVLQPDDSIIIPTRLINF